MDIESRCKALVEELGIAKASQVKAVRPLSGGVASDIAVVDLELRTFCVKFALPKLKVAADWQAPVHRNAAEYAWLEIAASVAPESAVKLYGRSDTLHGFAMEYVDGPQVYLWKDRLLGEAPDLGEAAKVGDLIGRIHAASSDPAFERGAFDNRQDFHALRIEPYLSYTRAAHPGLASDIEPLERMLFDSARVLVHGDVSPKNILFREGAPIILDAECATMGDACFDPAFCLNHLALKAVHLPNTRSRLLDDMGKFWSAYSAKIEWGDAPALERRVCTLLPALMLARVDGKSPVEYLTAAERIRVREFSMPLISSPFARLDDFVDRLARHLNGGKN